MPFDTQTLIVIHTLISLIALALGVPAIMALSRQGVAPAWTAAFLVTAAATTATGFILPFQTVTPAVATGIVASLVLIAVLAAHHAFHFSGAWRWIYASGMVMSVWLLAFVTVVQVFLKIPALNAYAPTGTEPPFAAAQLAVLGLFVFLGIRAVKQFRPV